MGTTKGATALEEPTQEAAIETSGTNGKAPDGGGLTLLTRDAILAADDIVTELVAVPEWGGAVMVWSLTGTERDAWEESMVEMRGRSRVQNFKRFRASLAARSIRDEKGRRLFSNEDVDRLGSKSASALQHVVNVAMKLSGLTPDQVDELTAELKDDPSASSGTD